ncbi:unnamed protein product [Cyclocybe aegerita]|uniref:Oxidase ustYa n=1 Tax=Cyclocybe aegerita TaxID=1973307 RepID=A0A8S0XZS7_CYCAE|nr:unnamed protein product [Cyclocybe aegerita]
MLSSRIFTPFLALNLFVVICARSYSVIVLPRAINELLASRSPVHRFFGDDTPKELPGHYPDVAMFFDRKDRNYPLTSNDAWNTMIPPFLGQVRLGPKGRPYGISMYHQLHCLNSLRYTYMVARYNLEPDPIAERSIAHTTHCFHVLRHSILCHADLTLVARNSTEEGESHRCRDWAQIRRFVEDNQAKWRDTPLTPEAWEDVR